MNWTSTIHQAYASLICDPLHRHHCSQEINLNTYIPRNYTSSGYRIPGVVLDALAEHDEPRAWPPTRENYEDDRVFLREVIPVIDAHVETMRRGVDQGSSVHLIRLTVADWVWTPWDVSVKIHAPVRCLFSKLEGRIGPQPGATPGVGLSLIGCADDCWVNRGIDRTEDQGCFRGFFNGLLLVPPGSRLRDTIETHVARHDHLYRRDGITRLDVRPVAAVDIPRVCRRVFRGVLNGEMPVSKGPLVLPDSSHD